MTVKWVKVDPLVMNGEPFCYGSRLTVRQLLELRRNGYTVTDLLTDHPELRYAPGAVLHREASDEPLTVAWSSPIADGPGWRVRFEEIRARSEAETLKGVYLEAAVGPASTVNRAPPVPSSEAFTVSEFISSSPVSSVSSNSSVDISFTRRIRVRARRSGSSPAHAPGGSRRSRPAP